LATPALTIDVVAYTEYNEWIRDLFERFNLNFDHFAYRVVEPQDDYWRSRMEEIAVNFIDQHREVAGIEPPTLFEPSHTKLVEGFAFYANLGRSLQSWLKSGDALSSKYFNDWFQMADEATRLIGESADLTPDLHGYEAVYVDASGSIILEGRGQQSYLKFNLNRGQVIFRMTHNGSRNFSIWLLDSRGGKIELLVNEIGAFNGSRPVQIEVAGSYILDISADGRWTVKVEQ